MGSYAEFIKAHDQNSILQPLLGSYSISSRAVSGGQSMHVSLIQSLGLAPVTKVPLPGGKTVSKWWSRVYLCCFLILVFLGACLFSVVAPFFPTRAIEKGMSQTVAGLVIGSMQLIQFFASVFFAFTMFHFGLKFMLVCGIVWASCCNILFGLLDLAPPGGEFTALCFLVRIVQGLGVSAYYISCFTMAAMLFTDNYGLVVGLLETFIAVGMLLGPTIGGALYSLGGYIMPFIVLGIILFCFAPVVYFIIPAGLGSEDEHKESPTRVFKVMFKPALIIVLYTMMTTTMSSVFTETTLGVRLAQFGVVDPLIVGLIYLSSSGAYAVTAPIAGRITDKYHIGWAVMLVGTVFCVIGYLIVGPSPMFNGIIPEGIPQLVIGCLFTHSGLASVQIPTTRELQRQASIYGLDPDDPSTLSFISAVFECTWGMGGFLGAFIAGALMENLGFPWATTVQALIVLSCFFLQFYTLWKFGILKNLIRKCRGYNDV